MPVDRVDSVGRLNGAMPVGHNQQEPDGVGAVVQTGNTSDEPRKLTPEELELELERLRLENENWRLQERVGALAVKRMQLELELQKTGDTPDTECSLKMLQKEGSEIEQEIEEAEKTGINVDEKIKEELVKIIGQTTAELGRFLGRAKKVIDKGASQTREEAHRLEERAKKVIDKGASQMGAEARRFEENAKNVVHDVIGGFRRLF